MEYFFRKYQFPSKEVFDDLILNTEINVYSTITELGILVDTYYSVDALWYNEVPDSWKEYEIWDIEGNGFHTYAGWQFNELTN